jgi:hypothetical protein
MAVQEEKAGQLPGLSLAVTVKITERFPRSGNDNLANGFAACKSVEQ